MTQERKVSIEFTEEELVYLMQTLKKAYLWGHLPPRTKVMYVSLHNRLQDARQAEQEEDV